MTYTKKEVRRALMIVAFCGLALFLTGLAVAAFASVFVGVALAAVGGVAAIGSAGYARFAASNVRIKERGGSLGVELPSSSHSSVFLKQVKNKGHKVRKAASHHIEKRRDHEPAGQSVFSDISRFFGSLFEPSVERSSSIVDSSHAKLHKARK